MNLATEQEHVGEEYSQDNELAIHKAIKKVVRGHRGHEVNTALAALMSLVNDFYAKGASRGDMKALLLMLSPFAPHMCEELWELAGYGGQVCLQPCPPTMRARRSPPPSRWPSKWAAR